MPGVDFSKALTSLEKQFSGTALGPVIGRIQLAIRRGSTLEEAMAAEPSDVQPDVPQHDQGRRGSRRRPRDLEDARPDATRPASA